ncbi:MAG: type II toxin-antitoxin system RelE/ParE family toxin [Chloroflexota bacterium]
MPYQILYDEEAIRHLRRILRRHHSLIKRAIEEQLRHEPGKAMRNCKPLKSGKRLWKLRCGPDNQFRVIYRLDRENKAVFIIAIGVKKGNRLLVEGKEYKP